MLVGMPFSGKTTALNTLQKALTDLAQDAEMCGVPERIQMMWNEHRRFPFKLSLFIQLY